MFSKEALKEWRVRNGLSQKKASELFGAALSTYQKWEAGSTTPQDRFLERLNNAINYNTEVVWNPAKNKHEIWGGPDEESAKRSINAINRAAAQKRGDRFYADADGVNHLVPPDKKSQLHLDLRQGRLRTQLEGYATELGVPPEVAAVIILERFLGDRTTP